MLKERNMHPTEKWQRHLKLLPMYQLGTYENISKIGINYTNKGNKIRSLYK